MMEYCIYAHISPNKKAYIGVTKFGNNPNKRWRKGRHYEYNKEFTQDIKKYSWGSFEHIILQYAHNEEFAYILEQMWVNYYKNRGTVYNITGGGKGALGTHCTEENKVKNSLRMKSNNPMYRENIRLKVSAALTGRKGTPMSDESKKMHSERMKLNNPMKNPEIARKVSDWKRGKHLSKEHIQKMSKSVTIEDIFNGVKTYYDSISDAAREINTTVGNICSVLSGRSKLIKRQYKAYYGNYFNIIND